jgi:hypothetical protein
VRSNGDHLRIREWDSYQHYKHRRPPWVKLHVKILEDEEQRSLSVPTRLVAVLLLAVAANRDNRIPNNPAWLSEEIAMPPRVIAAALADLQASGYLICTQSCTENAEYRDRDREDGIS